VFQRPRTNHGESISRRGGISKSRRGYGMLPFGVEIEDCHQFSGFTEVDSRSTAIKRDHPIKKTQLVLPVIALLIFPLVTVGFLGSPLASNVSAHNAPTRCGHKKGPGFGWDRLHGHNVGCFKARRVARRWERKCIVRGMCPRRVVKIRVKPGYTCRRRRIPNFEGVRVRCTADGRRVVHFRWGS